MKPPSSLADLFEFVAHAVAEFAFWREPTKRGQWWPLALLLIVAIAIPVLIMIYLSV